ncbi:MAG: phospholipase A [Pseudomonadota bacterium]
MLRIIIMAILVFINTAAFASDLETIVVAPSEPVISGKSITVEVYFLNPSDQIITANVPKIIKPKLINKNITPILQLSPKPFEPLDKIDIPANGFIKKLYTFDVPESLEGSVGIELVTFTSKRVLFNVVKTDEKDPKCVSETPKRYDTAEEIQALFQKDFPYFPSNEPTYFGVGTDPEKSKFQFSFKYRILDVDKHEWAKNRPWLSGFHFGYTQTSLWDLKSDSKPFDDTSYKPELFYLTRNIRPGFLSMSHLCLKSGFQHESNGKGGTDSRSTNYLYIKPISAFDLGNDYHLKVAPKVWIYAGNDNDTNPDIKNYRGYFDLELKAGKSNGLAVGSNLRYGKKGGSIQLDATYPFYKILFLDENQDWLNPNLYFLVQYYNGYAESLIRYNEKSHALRLGISLVR